MKHVIKRGLRRLGVAVMSARSERELLGYREGVAEVLALPPATLQALAPAAAGARSQLGQDLFALYANGVERGGYFVEFGATDGRTLSNTYLLEDGYGWRGILAEPARKWHDALRANRGCHIETDCVWRATGERLAFLEAGVGELSTIAQFAGADHHAGARRGAREYTVRTISLLDLLDKYDAPRASTTSPSIRRAPSSISSRPSISAGTASALSP